MISRVITEVAKCPNFSQTFATATAPRAGRITNAIVNVIVSLQFLQALLHLSCLYIFNLPEFIIVVILYLSIGRKFYDLMGVLYQI